MNIRPADQLLQKSWKRLAAAVSLSLVSPFGAGAWLITAAIRGRERGTRCGKMWGFFPFLPSHHPSLHPSIHLHPPVPPYMVIKLIKLYIEGSQCPREADSEREGQREGRGTTAVHPWCITTSQNKTYSSRIFITSSSHFPDGQKIGFVLRCGFRRAY